jgi:predicted MFS family arabinose efflux permease
VTSDQQARNTSFAVYRHLFDPPGTGAFVGAGFVARLTVSMSSLGLVLAMTSGGSRGYSEAGLVVAAFGLASALVSPYVGRLMDRQGQRAVLLPLAAVFTASMVATTAAITSGAASWLVLPLAIVAGASMPVCGPLVRTRWAKVYGGSRMLRVSYAFESVTDEIVYIVGPVAVAVVATSFGTGPSLLVVAGCAAVGTVALALQTRTQPEPSGPAPSRGHRARAVIRFLPLQVTCIALLGIGGALGALEIITVAYAESRQAKGYSGALLAVMGVASMVAGLVFGAIKVNIGPARQLALAVGLFGGVLVSLRFVDGLGILAVLLFFVGLLLAPAMITCMELVQKIVPPDALTEAMTWASAAIGIGLTAGSFVGGVLIDAWSPASYWLVPAAFTLAAAAVVVAALARMERAVRN